jgi:uncharacterized protein YkwD
MSTRVPRRLQWGALAVAALAWVCAAGAAELGAAPQRVESQDISGWSQPRVPKAALTREGVAALYRSAYLPGASVPLGWTGSLAGCDPGATDGAHQQAVIGRVNYFRALVDLPPVELLGAAQTSQAQAAALMMSANDALSHMPPASWLCYSAAGATGASSSNIALGVMGVDAVDLFMDDPGSSNFVTGHRRWVLFPPRTAMATGDVPGGQPAAAARQRAVRVRPDHHATADARRDRMAAGGLRALPEPAVELQPLVDLVSRRQFQRRQRDDDGTQRAVRAHLRAAGQRRRIR